MKVNWYNRRMETGTKLRRAYDERPENVHGGVRKKLPQEFVRVTQQVDPKYEITAIIKKLDLMGKYPMVLFENVKGYSTPVVCNTETSVTKYGLALGIPPERVEDFYTEKEEEAIRLNKYPAKEIQERGSLQGRCPDREKGRHDPLSFYHTS